MGRWGARTGAAVVLPGVRERRPPGRHGEQLYTYFYFPLAYLPGGKTARLEGRVERWGLRGEVSCAHLRADLEVGAPVTPKLPGRLESRRSRYPLGYPAGWKAGAAGMPTWRAALPECRVERWGLRGEVSCAHLRADLEVGAPGGAPGIPLPSLFSPCLPCRLESRRLSYDTRLGLLLIKTSLFELGNELVGIKAYSVHGSFMSCLTRKKCNTVIVWGGDNFMVDTLGVPVSVTGRAGMGGVVSDLAGFPAGWGGWGEERG